MKVFVVLAMPVMLAAQGQAPSVRDNVRPADAAPTIEEYNPKTVLVVPRTDIKRAKFPFIDVHMHHRDTSPEYLKKLITDMDSLNLRVMINSPVNGSFGERSIKMTQGFKAFDPVRFPGSMTNLDFSGANDPDYPDKVAAQLEKDIQGGAVGLKLHKAFGMGVRDAQGNRVHVDDPRFDKAFAVAAKYKIPVLIHTADPKALFDPFDKDNERWLELKQRPGRGNTKEPDIKWEDIMGEQHRLFAKHPNVIFINAHFGWLAHDLGRLGALLDRLPNVNLEIAAILGELGRQPRNARKFFIKYQDRILFGKDTYRPEEYAFYFRVLETEDEYFDNIRRYHGLWKLYGLALPDDVLKKVYYKNAIRLFRLSDAGFPK